MELTNNPILSQILFSVPVWLIELLAGILYGWSAPAITFLKSPESEIPITIEEVTWISSLCEVGRFIGCIPAGVIADKIGRKISITISAGIYTISWIIIAFSKSVVTLYVGRFTLGIALGMADVVNGMYVTEIPSGNLRGIIAASCLTLYFLGILFEFTLSFFLSYTMMNMTVMIMSAVVFICTFFIIETPQYLITISKFDKALTNLEMIRKKADAKIECDEITKDIETKNGFRIKNTQPVWEIPANRRTVMMVVGLSMLTVFTGFQPITAYVSLLFPKEQSSSNYLVLYGIVTFLASCITPLVIERAGRRMLLLTSLFLSTLIHSLVAVLYISEMDVPPYALFTLLTMFAAIYSCSTFPVAGVLRGELLPQSVRGVGTSIAIASTCIAGFLTTKLFHEIISDFGIHWNFLIFSVFSALSFLWVYLLLPETKGKSLLQIQELFSSK